MEQDLRAFFAAVFPDLEGLYLQIWTLPDKISRRYTKTADAVLAIEDLSKTKNVYVGCGLSAQNLGAHSRGTAEQIKAIPGLWLDVDFGITHKKQGLPPTETEALALIKAMGPPPTVVVRTGGGFHCWWVFKELWVFDSDEERLKAAALEKAWNDTFRAHSAKMGYTCDSVHDLTRVLRPAGTINHKGGDKFPVRLFCCLESSKFNPETDFDQYLIECPNQAEELALPDLDLQFTLSEKAQPPALKFQALMDNEPKFRQSWTQTGNLPSQSEYDLSLATYCHIAGWTPQEIVDALITNRRLHQGELKLRRDYYLQTLRKAMQNQVAIERAVLVDQFRDTGTLPEEVKKDPAEMLKIASEIVCLPITEVINYPSDVGKYTLVINGMKIDFGPIETLTIQSRFWNRVADTQYLHGQAAMGLRTAFKKAKWGELVDLLMRAQTVVDLHEGSSTESYIQYQLPMFLTNTIMTDDTDATDAADCALNDTPFCKNQTVYFSSTTFRRFLTSRGGDKIKLQDLTTCLSRLGYRPVLKSFHIPATHKKRHDTRDGDFSRRLWYKHLENGTTPHIL